MILPHTLTVFQKPKIGTSFIRSFPAYNYRHSINAIGGFDTASCDIAIRSRDEGQQFLDQYLGNRVAFYVDNPVEPIWEGFINRMSFNAGGVQYSIGLDKMANRVAVTYTDNTGTPVTGTTGNDTNSQALYGLKAEKIDLGPQNTGTTVLTAVRDVILGQRAFPKSSILPMQGGSNLLHIEFLGFFHTLEWEFYQDATVANVTFSNYLINQLLPGVTNGTTFFDNTDTSQITTNALNIQRTSIRGNTIWDRMQTIRDGGDASSYYVLGIYPTDFQLGTRRFYYKQASSTVIYTARQADGLRIRNLYGQIVDPWRVRPDNGVMVSDMLIGWNGIGDNPTETYILKIDYDANSQSCLYSGDDDLSAEGVFNLKRFNKSHGKRFGAVTRFS